MALTPQDVQHLHESVKKLLELWMNTKLVFLKAFSEAEISREHETAFLQLKSEVSRTYRSVANNLPKGLMFDGDKLMEILKNAMTMEHLGRMPVQDRQSYLASWHRIYIMMMRTLGALEVMNSGYFPHMHRDRIKSAKSAGKAKPAKV